MIAHTDTETITLTGSISRDSYGFSLRLDKPVDSYGVELNHSYMCDYLFGSFDSGSYAFILQISFEPEYDPYQEDSTEVVGGTYKYKLTLTPQ